MQKRRSSLFRRARSSKGDSSTDPFARRATPRIPARRTAWLTLEAPKQQELLAFFRDISAKGAFFYSDLAPAVGDQLDFVVEFLSGAEQMRLHLKGSVLRVERASGGQVPGVAVKFQSPSKNKAGPRKRV